MSKFVSVGATVFDMYAAWLPHLPATERAMDEFDESALVHMPQPFVCSVGGNAGNTALVVARLGLEAILYSPLGDDLFADWLRTRLQESGVELIELPPRETSVNVVGLDLHGRRTSLFRPVALETEPLLGAAASLALAERDTLLLGGYPHPNARAMCALAAAAANQGATVAIDIGPGLAGLTENMLQDTLQHTDVLFGNDAELTVLMAGDSEQEVATEAVNDFARRWRLRVVAKHGARGASLHDGGQTTRVPAFPCKHGPITVGAGDAFNGGFLAAVTETKDALKALRFGAAVAAIVVGRARGMAGAPTRSEVDEYLASQESS